MSNRVPDQCHTCGGFDGPGHTHKPYIDHKQRIVEAAIRFRNTRPTPDGHAFRGDLREMDEAEEALIEAVDAYRSTVVHDDQG